MAAIATSALSIAAPRLPVSAGRRVRRAQAVLAVPSERMHAPRDAAKAPVRAVVKANAAKNFAATAAAAVTTYAPSALALVDSRCATYTYRDVSDDHYTSNACVETTHAQTCLYTVCRMGTEGASDNSNPIFLGINDGANACSIDLCICCCAVVVPMAIVVVGIWSLYYNDLKNAGFKSDDSGLDL
eukprot:scaffold952_cov409-Prasinococcus_capsulatus_cf.AAC.19